MDSLFTFDVSKHDVITDGFHLVFIKSDHLQITLDQSLVDVDGIYGYWVREFDKLEQRWIEVFINSYPDQHQIAAFMEANASVCVLRIDKEYKGQYIDEIEEAEGLGMRVIYEPEIAIPTLRESVNEFYHAFEMIAG